MRRPPIGVILLALLVIAMLAGGAWWLRTNAANAAEQAAKFTLEQQGTILVANGKHIEVLNSMQPIDDAVFAKIADLGHLHTCNLSGSQVTDAQMVVLGKLPKLLILQVDNSPGVTSEGLSHVTGLKSLEKLFANNTSIDDAGLVHLGGMGNLTTVDLSYTKITDEGLKDLVPLPSLEVLRICGTEVTDAGVESLKAMPALKLLNVANTKITPEGVKALKAARSGLTVEEEAERER